MYAKQTVGRIINLDKPRLTTGETLISRHDDLSTKCPTENVTSYH
jgi:hypothetical protein